MKQLLRRLNYDLRGWMIILATVSLALFAYTLLIKSPPKSKTSSELLPKPSCPGTDNTSDKRLNRTYTAANFKVVYAVSGCNKLPIDIGNKISENALQSSKRLAAIGFPPPRETVVFGALVQPADSFQTFIGDRESAAYVDAYKATGSKLLVTSQVLSEVSLASVARGLTDTSRSRVATALSILATGQSSLHTFQIDRGKVTPQTVGVFDAWLASQGKVTDYKEAIRKCSSRCSWPEALSRSLGKKTSLRKAAQRFANSAYRANPAAKKRFVNAATKRA